MLFPLEISLIQIFVFDVQFTPEKFIQTLKLMEHRYGAKDFVTS